MNRTRIALAVLLGTATFLTSVPASPAAAQPPASGAAPDGHRGFDVEARLAELRTRLTLDAAQTTQVRAILEDGKRRMEALRAEGGAPSPERHRARRDILWSVEDRIWALLTCAQKDAFRLYHREQMAERMERRHAEHGGHGAHGGQGGRGGHGGHGGHGGRGHHGGADDGPRGR